MITTNLLFNNTNTDKYRALPNNGRCECAATRFASIMRGDKHLGRSKAGEKSFLSWAGSDWHTPGK
jgi:hypothetical protein